MDFGTGTPPPPPLPPLFLTGDLAEEEEGLAVDGGPAPVATAAGLTMVTTGFRVSFEGGVGVCLQSSFDRSSSRSNCNR